MIGVYVAEKHVALEVWPIYASRRGRILKIPTGWNKQKWFGEWGFAISFNSGIRLYVMSGLSTKSYTLKKATQ